ncbi:CASP-like protein 4A1 [Rhodamnia argentea]|uniref:CASP-like protein n=1 Tax=Rhodamnia argentea TaxID=178133 RepID=A0ABM3GXJ9_9MYRT|nr:CASP-like protein 4A1 [Rhodamnia argentea]
MEGRPQHQAQAEDDHQRADQQMEEEEEEEEQEQEKRQSSAAPPPSSSHSKPSKPTTPPGPGDDELPSPMPSPLHPIDSPSHLSLSSDQSSISRLSSPREDALANWPPPTTANPDSPPQLRPLPLAVAASVKRSVRDGPGPLTVVDPGAESAQVKQESGAVAGDSAATAGVGGGGDGSGRVRPNLSILRRARRDRMVRRALLVLRVCGLVLCLVSFSVMVADKNQGWALDSFYRYREFRYIVAVNAIGFVYSGLQACDVSYFSATGKGVARFRLRHYLDFFLDQVMSYLLLSASSSAATRVDDWELNWGEDKFPQMATASVALSILAFMAFALCSIISGYTLCTLRSS